MRREKIKDGTRWGSWRFAADTMHLVLDYEGDKEAYAIPLQEITSSARMLDWIFQLRMKVWVTNEIMGDLLSAFQDIYYPQATLCGQGIDKTLNASAHLDALLR